MEQTAANDRGARWGWIGGCLGASCWIPIVSIVLLVHGDVFGGIAGFVIYTAILWLIHALRPWKRPDAPFWKIYLGILAPILLSAVFFLWRYGTHVDPSASSGLSLFMIVPFLIPFVVLGDKSWNDMHRSRE